MNNSYRPRKKKKFDVLMVLAAFLFIAGVALLLVDPIRTYLRNKKTEEGYNLVQEQIAQNAAAKNEDDITEITFVVPKDANEVNGEEYDIFTDNEEEKAAMSSMLDEEYDNMPDYVTLKAIGILQIDSVDINIVVWDVATRVSLRYGGGHYGSSVLPGQYGNCSILAHHMRHAETNFHNLDKVKVGDEIKFTVVNGTTFTYVVDQIKTVHAYELEENLQGNITKKRRITLVTCSYTETEKMRLLVIGHIKE